jgi:AcrR family transcriptional regulator
LYKYFDSKEKILDALRVEGWQRSSEMQQKAFDPQASVSEQLHTSGSVYQQFARQYPELYQLMFNVSESGPQQNLSEITETANFNRLSEMIRHGMEKGDLHLPASMSPEQLRWLAWFMSHGIAMLRMTLMRSCQDEFDEVAAQVLRAFTDSFK